jgi:hypothetical protein
MMIKKKYYLKLNKKKEKYDKFIEKTSTLNTDNKNIINKFFNIDYDDDNI